VTKITTPIRPFEEGDVAAEEEAIARLVSYASDMFWGDVSARLGVDIRDIDTMHMGVYRKLRQPRRVEVLKKDFTIAVKYALIVDRNPLTIETLDPAEEDGGRPYDVAAYEPSEDLRPLYLLHWDVLGDVSVDDEDELRRVGFPKKFASALGNMSTEARDVYKQNLEDIRGRPPALESVSPRKFVQTLASYGTYTGRGIAMPGGKYFQKWEKQPGPTPASYSPEMLQNATREVTLQARGDYLMLVAETGYRLFALQEKDGVLDFTELIGSFDSFHDVLPASKRTTYRAIFFHAINGDKETDARRRRTYEVTGRGAQRLMLDPRRMVESLADESIAGKLGIGEPYDWFCEMVIGYFPSRFYVLDFRDAPIRPADQPLRGVKEWADQETEAILNIGDPKDPWFAPVDELRKKEILDLITQPDVVVLPQGMKVSPRARFVGADHSWCYIRDLKTGAVYAQRRGEFVYDMYVGGISQLVYEASAGVTPLLVLLFATAAAIPVALFAGPAAVARWISKEATRRTAEEIAKDLAKRMVPVVAAQMASLAATMFIVVSDEQDEKKGAGHRWRAFADGFFKGYLVNTIHDSFFRDTIVKNLYEGIPEYRYYRWARRIYATVDKVQRVVQLLEENLDRKSIDRGMELFKGAMNDTMKGVLLLASALYYSDYDDAKAALEVFGVGPDGEAPPNPAEWELEAGNQLAEIAGHIKKELNLENLDRFLEELKTSKTLSLAITAFILKPYIWKELKETWRNRPFKWKKWEVKWIRPARPAIVLVVVASMAGVLVYANDKTDGKLFDVAGDILEEMFMNLAEPDVDAARVHGEIVGNVLGVFAFNSFIHKEPTFANRKRNWADKSLGDKWQTMMDSPLLGTAMQSGLKIGAVKPILKLVFKRYVALYEKLRSTGIFDASKTEQTIGELLSIAEDGGLQAQGLGHLSSFKTDKESIAFSLEHLLVVLYRLRSMLASDLRTYLEKAYAVPEHRQRLEDDWAAFQKLARDSGLSDAIEAHSQTAYLLMTAHLQTAVQHLQKALEKLMTRFTKAGQSWMSLLRELGLDVDIEEAEKVLERERERLKIFEEETP
jgi:hypothetical protein